MTRRLLAPFLAVLLAGVVSASEPLDEYGVKSAFLFNLLPFVEWQSAKLGAHDPLAVCVVDDSPIAAKLGALNKQVAKGHQVHIRTVSTPADVAACHVVFLSSNAIGRLPELAHRYPGAGLLFVSEQQDEAPDEAVFNLVVANGRIAFDVNLDAARGQALTVSSKLMPLARHIVRAPAAPMGRDAGRPAGGN